MPERTSHRDRTQVVNLKGHRDDPGYADVVYVGRAMHRGGWHLPASPLASPFRPGPDGSGDQVVARYREYLLGRPDLLALLRGRRLGCWCAPLPCHAQVIAEIADSGAGQNQRSGASASASGASTAGVSGGCK